MDSTNINTNFSMEVATWIQAIGTVLAVIVGFYSVRKLIKQNNLMKKMFELESAKIKSLTRPYFKNSKNNVYLTTHGEQMRYNSILTNVGNGEAKNISMNIWGKEVEIKDFRIVSLANNHNTITEFEVIKPNDCFQIYIYFVNTNNLPDEKIKLSMVLQFDDADESKYIQRVSIVGRNLMSHTPAIIEEN